MKRKVIKQASQAYTITLPIDWVRQNQISNKSEVDVTVSERSLIIGVFSTVYVIFIITKLIVLIINNNIKIV